MKIKGITEIKSARNGCLELKINADMRDSTVIYIVGSNMRINIENSNDVEVFVDQRGYKNMKDEE